MMSVQVFMLALVFLGTLNKQLQVCKYNSAGDILPGQSGCYNLQPVFKWIKRCIISIFLVFWIAFVPLFVQGESSCGLPSQPLLTELVLPTSSLANSLFRFYFETSLPSFCFRHLPLQTPPFRSLFSRTIRLEDKG